MGRRAKLSLLFLLLVVLAGCRGFWTSVPVDAAPSSGGSSGAPSAEAGSEQPACRAVIRTTPKTRTRPDARRMPRIVGGAPSAPGAWPFVAALEYADGWQYCGAALVRPSWLLTAAHCGTEPSELAVLGRTDLTKPGGETIPILEVRVHELFTGPAEGNDVALLRLSYASTKTPVAMVEAGWQGPGLLATIIGWGLTSETAPAPSPILREAEVPIMAAGVCQLAYPGLPTTALCAGLAEGGRDTCQGDSGGPLLVSDGGWRVAGITSYGDGCARPGRPGIYTDVGSVREWIDRCLGDGGPDG